MERSDCEKEKLRNRSKCLMTILMKNYSIEKVKHREIYLRKDGRRSSHLKGILNACKEMNNIEGWKASEKGI